MARETDATLRRLRQLKGLGVRLAIDDFGTGYSSLELPAPLPDRPRQDRQELHRRDRRASQPSCAFVARRSSSSPTASRPRPSPRASRRRRRSKRLSRIGCDLAQGFHFSRPMDVAEATEYVVGHTTISLWVGHRGRGARRHQGRRRRLRARQPRAPGRRRRRRRRRADPGRDRARGPGRTSSARSSPTQFAAYWSDGLLLDLGPYLARDRIDPGQFLGPTHALHAADGRALVAADARRHLRAVLRPGAVRGGRADRRSPRTIDELTELRQAADDAQPADGSLDVVGFMPLFGFYENFVANFGHMFGARWADAGGRSSLALGSRRGRTMLRWQKELVDWYGHADLARFQAEVGEEFSTANAFQAGRLAMGIDGEWRVAFLAAQAPRSTTATAPVPVHETVPELLRVGLHQRRVIGIPVDADHKAESWKLVSYLATDDEALAKLSNGLRNVPSTTASPGIAAARSGRAVRGLPRHLGASPVLDGTDHGAGGAVPGRRRDVHQRVAIRGGIRPAGGVAGGRSPDRRAARAGGAPAPGDDGPGPPDAAAIDGGVGEHSLAPADPAGHPPNLNCGIRCRKGRQRSDRRRHRMRARTNLRHPMLQATKFRALDARTVDPRGSAALDAALGALWLARVLLRSPQRRRLGRFCGVRCCISDDPRRFSVQVGAVACI